MSNKLKLYFAAPLFSLSERTFNEHVTKLIEEYFVVFLPQRDGGLMDKMIKDGMSVSKASKVVFDIDIQALRTSDIVLGVLDGSSVDEGVAIELGFAYALNIPCIGLQTDVRRQLPYGNNPMIDNIFNVIHCNINDLIIWANKYATVSTHSNLVYLNKL